MSTVSINARPLLVKRGHVTPAVYGVDPVTRFWMKVDKSGDCWLWLGNPAHRYGFFAISATRRVAPHRYSYELAHGPIPDGMQVLHTCDVPKCVNPAHLWLGTQDDNMKDKARKGRASHAGYAPRLTPTQVAELRARYAQGDITQAQLGAEYGLHQTRISQLVQGVLPDARHWSKIDKSHIRSVMQGMTD